MKLTVKNVSIPNRVLGIFRPCKEFSNGGAIWVSIPNRVLGIFRPLRGSLPGCKIIVSIPNRVLGIFRLGELAKLISFAEKVSIPNRVLGIFRPPVPEGLLYLVFNVHLRLY